MARGGRRPGSGRPKGAKNKVSADAKQTLEECFSRLGGIDFMTVWAQENPDGFFKLWGKLVPTGVQLEQTGPGLEEMLEESRLLGARAVPVWMGHEGEEEEVV